MASTNTPRDRDGRIRIERTDAAYATTAQYAAFRRIRWGAIFAGALIAVAVSFALNLLGLGIGLGSINPTTEARPFSGLGTGTLIWYIIANLIALFAGGYVAGRMSGFPKKSTAGLHGLLSWALFTFLSLFILNSAVGKLFNVVGSTLSTVGNAAGSVVQTVVPDSLGQKLQQSNISLADIRQEAFAILEDTEKQALDPDNLERRAQNAADIARRNADDVATSPAQAGSEINQILDRIGNKGDDVVQAADKQALVNVLTNRTDMSESEARNTVDGWANQYDQAMTTVRQELRQLGDTAEEVGGDVASTLSTVAIIGFFALLVGALAGLFGGMAGRQKDLTMPSAPDESIAATET